MNERAREEGESARAYVDAVMTKVNLLKQFVNLCYSCNKFTNVISHDAWYPRGLRGAALD